MAQKKRHDSTGLEHQPERGRGASRLDPIEAWSTPFGMLRRMQEDLDDALYGRGRSDRQFASERATWAPEIEVFQRGNEFVVRADVPGLSRDDVSVEVGDDALTIRGERRYEHEEEKEGMFRSERSYGTFCRVVPLPEGVVTDDAKANFKNGVLEVVMPAPPQEVRRGRQIEIGEGDR